MPTIAEQLRDARERQKLSVYDVAEATKIKTDHVRALEEGNYGVFPAPVYIRGFVRTCATLLKLDVSKVMKELDAELSGTKRFSEPPSLTNRSDGVLDFLTLQLSKVNWQWAVILLALGLFAWLIWAGFGAWQRYKTTDPLANLGPALYESSPQSGELLPLPAAP